jgi:hypothetical protein
LLAVFDADWGSFDDVCDELRIDSWWSKDDRGDIYKMIDALMEEGEVGFHEGAYHLTEQGDARMFGPAVS